MGSTSPGDTKWDLFIGSKLVATLMNTTGGANIVPVDTDYITIRKYVKDGTPVRLICRDASNGNVIAYKFIFTKFVVRRRRRNRRRF